MAYKFTGRFHEAEDLTQEIFLKVYKALESYDKEQEFCGWLIGITRNACIDFYRRSKRERLIMGGNSDEIKNFKFEGLSPQGNLEAAERSMLIRKSLKELPDELRAVLILRDLKGLSYGEIVQELNLAEGTVKSRIYRGRLELAARLRGVFRPIDNGGKECTK